ncbi:MAG: type II secretion system F family protein [bacterium]|nr:type II secretion system F family protein [bacterium]
MAVYAYVAMNNRGKEISGSVEAETSTLAISQIRDMGYFPTKVYEKSPASGTSTSAKSAKAGSSTSMNIQIKLPGIGDRIKPRQLAVFVRQLATLLGAGLPLLRSLNVLKDQAKPGIMKETFSGIAADIEGGATFSDALAKYPKSFSKLFVNMIKAGEVGGILEAVLERLAEFSEKEEALKKKIKAAMVYPILVTVAAAGILTFLIIVVIPTFKKMFEDFNTELPGATVMLLKMSDVFKDWRNILVVLGSLVGLFIIYKLIRKTQKGLYYSDKLKLYIPIIGPLARKTAIGRFARTFATLIGSGVPILQALTIVKDTSGNDVIAQAMASVRDSIREGESIAGPLQASGIFPPLVTNMVDVGEETGALDKMLLKVADAYDQEVDAAVAALTSAIEPIMIVGMGGVVGFIVVALFLPLIKLATAIV